MSVYASNNKFGDILQSSAFVMIFNCIAGEFLVVNTKETSAEGHTRL